MLNEYRVKERSEFFNDSSAFCSSVSTSCNFLLKISRSCTDCSKLFFKLANSICIFSISLLKLAISDCEFSDESKSVSFSVFSRLNISTSF